jgi:hypothetical protein
MASVDASEIPEEVVRFADDAEAAALR